MGWYRASQSAQIGFRVVSWNGQRAVSLQNQRPVNLQVGASEENLYLGTDRQFCLDYYTGLTDDQDMLLSYSYSQSDIISGGAGEIFVRKGTLQSSELL